MYYKRYKRLKEQSSTDGGHTWSDTGVYKKGDLIDTGDWETIESCESVDEPEQEYQPYSILYSSGSSTTTNRFYINTYSTGDSPQPNKVNELYKFNISKLTSFNNFCYGLYNLTSIKFVGEWDSNSLNDMTSMFNQCTNLEVIKGIEKINPENVTKMTSSFISCRKLKELDLSSWNTPRLESTNRMFYYCSELKKLNLSNFSTRNLTDVYYMFYGCNSLEELDISKFDISTSNSSYIGYMFDGCTSLNYIKCTQKFMDWCKTNKTKIRLDNFDTITWDIVD